MRRVSWRPHPPVIPLGDVSALDETGKAAFRPAWGAMMAEVAGLDRRRRGRVMSQLSAADDAGEVVGPIVAGVLWSAWGLPVLLGARIFLALIAEVLTALVTGPLHRRAERPRPRTAEPVGETPTRGERSAREGPTAKAPARE